MRKRFKLYYFRFDKDDFLAADWSKVDVEGIISYFSALNIILWKFDLVPEAWGDTVVRANGNFY